MRLLNISTFDLEEFFERDIPPYYILSHRWGTQELSYQEFVTGQFLNDGEGFQKIKVVCNFARTFEPFDYRTGLPVKVNHIWCDTICIDKRSSAELSEAINSMFSWYQKATTCFVYLNDIDALPSAKLNALANSAWFRRGCMCAPRYTISSA